MQDLSLIINTFLCADCNVYMKLLKFDWLFDPDPGDLIVITARGLHCLKIKSIRDTVVYVFNNQL